MEVMMSGLKPPKLVISHSAWSLIDRFPTQLPLLPFHVTAAASYGYFNRCCHRRYPDSGHLSSAFVTGYYRGRTAARCMEGWTTTAGTE